MKRTISIVLTILFCFSLVRPVLPYIEYTFNHDYIAKVLCINKEQPELKCDGKCYLKAQLSKVNEDNRTKEERVPKIEFEKFPIICHRAKDFLVPSMNFKTDPAIWNYMFSINDHASRPPTPPPEC